MPLVEGKPVLGLKIQQFVLIPTDGLRDFISYCVVERRISLHRKSANVIKNSESFWSADDLETTGQIQHRGLIAWLGRGTGPGPTATHSSAFSGASDGSIQPGVMSWSHSQPKHPCLCGWAFLS